MRLINLLIYIALVYINISFAAASIDGLINLYDYSFYNGTINITSYADSMSDRDNDGKNDTLTINLETDASLGAYRFIAEIDNGNDVIINSTEKTVTSGDNKLAINFPSELLAKQKFNYSIRVNDASNNLVFRSSNIESRTHGNYEHGISIISLSDENSGNNFMKLILTIDSPSERKENVTVTLAYNSSKISKTEEKALSAGMQTISIQLDNETIKGTHYKGNFTAESAKIGNKKFHLNQNTSLYDYELFAKTSYIKQITDGKIDLDDNGLNEFLKINFTIEVKEAGNYEISYELYDQLNNFFINASKSQALAIGTQNIKTLINGSEIYKMKIDGPYRLSFAKLSAGNEVRDIIFDAHATMLGHYTDYEKPNLPDLMIALKAVFNNSINIANVTVNLSNTGNAPAFNIFVDIFDNASYGYNTSLAFLDKGESKVFNIWAATSSAIFTAIADFDNLVQESDENNNIASSPDSANDLDKDGIPDDIDMLIGDASLVNTTISNLTIKIGDDTDLSVAFNGSRMITFIEGGSLIMEFNFNLSKMLNLTRIMVEKQKNGSFGYTLIHGLALERTKTVYLDRINNAVNGICIKDAAVMSISQISENCDGINETKVECDGTLQNLYMCGYNSTTSKYKVSGLKNSGIRQISYTRSVESSSSSSGEEASNEIGSGASGSCLEKWQCSEWSSCINNLQVRACKDANGCNTLINKPKEAQLCTIENSVINPVGGNKESNVDNSEKNDAASKNKKYSLPPITGFLLNPPEDANRNVGILIVSAIVVAGLVGYFYFYNQN